MDKYGLFLRKSKRYSLIDPTGQSNQIESIDTGSGPSFEDILEARLPAGTVKISPDVTESLQMAGIELTPMELDRLCGAYDDAEDFALRYIVARLARAIRHA